LTLKAEAGGRTHDPGLGIGNISATFGERRCSAVILPGLFLLPPAPEPPNHGCPQPFLSPRRARFAWPPKSRASRPSRLFSRGGIPGAVITASILRMNAVNLVRCRI